MLAAGLEDGDGVRWAERIVKDVGVPQVEADFAEDKLAERHVVTLAEGGDEGPGGSVARRGFAVAVEQDVRVDGGHDAQGAWVWSAKAKSRSCSAVRTFQPTRREVDGCHGAEVRGASLA
jgi:hypothetical protein